MRLGGITDGDEEVYERCVRGDGARGRVEEGVGTKIGWFCYAMRQVRVLKSQLSCLCEFDIGSISYFDNWASEVPVGGCSIIGLVWHSESGLRLLFCDFSIYNPISSVFFLPGGIFTESCHASIVFVSLGCLEFC